MLNLMSEASEAVTSDHSDRDAERHPVLFCQSASQRSSGKLDICISLQHNWSHDDFFQGQSVATGGYISGGLADASYAKQYFPQH